MSPEAVVALVLVSPVAIVVIVALIRGYTILVDRRKESDATQEEGH